MDNAPFVEDKQTTMVYFVLFTTVLVYLFVMKNHFNTILPNKALREERERNVMEDQYEAAHQRREQFVQHLAWAKSRKA